jgi:hypothetical protein
MRRSLLLALVFILYAVNVSADSTIRSLTEDTSPTSDDLVYTVNNPSGTPADRKVTVGNLAKGMSSTNLSDTANIAYENAEANFTDNVIVTGDIRGKINVTAYQDNPHTLAVADCKGQFHLNGDDDAIEYDLPDVEAGLNCCFGTADIVRAITLDPNGSEKILVDGTSAGDGVAIASDAAVGQFICLLGISDTEWLSLGRAGTWD